MVDAGVSQRNLRRAAASGTHNVLVGSPPRDPVRGGSIVQLRLGLLRPRCNLDRTERSVHGTKNLEDDGNDRPRSPTRWIELPDREPGHTSSRQAEQRAPSHAVVEGLARDAQEFGRLGRVPPGADGLAPQQRSQRGFGARLPSCRASRWSTLSRRCS